jgi:hypothetical protein
VTGPSMFEVLSRTTRPPGRDDVRWFDVEIRVCGVPAIRGKYTDTPSDGSGRQGVGSLDSAEVAAREEFGAALAALVAPRRRWWQRKATS